MPADFSQPLSYARQQLVQIIQQIQQGGQQENLLPVLETVLTQLDSLSRHDHLTGALNRRALLQALEVELARSFRTGHTFSLALISIDALEQILEQHGQAAARAVLQQVARLASGQLRTLDAFGRVAANEFAIVMPTTWLDQSQKALARLKGALQLADWSAVAPALQISFCAGITSNVQGDRAEAMLQRAADALRDARAIGPDRISQREPGLPDFDPAAE